MKTEDLQDKLWAWVSMPGYKGHYCPKKLAAALAADLTQRRDRDHPECEGEFSIEAVEDGFIDLPGMCMVDRPIEKLKIDTFRLEIPSQDFGEFLWELAHVHKRVFADGQEYYKFHGWRACVVVTPEQRDLLLQSMTDMLPQVKERAEAADREFSRRMDEINKGGVKVLSHRDKYSKNAPQKVPVPKKENN
jgi:hypothetical protein